MKLEQLSADSRLKLDNLLSAMEQVLNTSSSPHTRAVSESSMPIGTSPNDTLVGGGIRTPSPPPLTYDRKAISALHRALLQSGDDHLFGIVVIAQRPDSQGKWQLRSKVISKAEHDELVKARQRIDSEIERELRDLATGPDWERISFGQDMPGKEAIVTIRDKSGLKRVQPKPKLLMLLDTVRRLYGEQDFDLVVAFWTLRPAGLEFREVIE